MSNYEPKIALDLRKLQHSDWLLLGEIQSKINHLRMTPLDDKTKKRLSDVFLAKGISATTAIEGNTLTQAQVKAILTENKQLPKSQQYLEQEVLNIKRALDTVKETLEQPLTIEILNAWNADILRDLSLHDDIASGELRKINVHVGSYFPPPPERCKELVIELCEYYNNALQTDVLKAWFGDQEIASAVIKAIFAHVILVLIHPFADGNGRTSRLIETRTLMTAQISYMSSQLLSNFYNKTRTKYIEHLSQIWQRPETHIYPFISYALKGLADEVREQIDIITLEIIIKVIEHDLYTNFKKENSSINRRRRDLCLFFSKKPFKHYTLDSLFEEPAIYKLYKGKTIRSLSSDLKAMIERNYIQKAVTNKESIYTLNLSSWLDKFPETHKG